MRKIVHQKVRKLIKQIWVAGDVVIEILVCGDWKVRNDKVKEITVFHNDGVFYVLVFILAVGSIHKTRNCAVNFKELGGRVVPNIIWLPAILTRCRIVKLPNFLSNRLHIYINLENRTHCKIKLILVLDTD